MSGFSLKIASLVCGLLAIFSVRGAEKVTFEVRSPLTVAVGEAFRVEFVINAKPEDGSFNPPTFEGFDVIAGPAVARGNTISVVNGTMTQSTSVTNTFVLMAQEAGTIQIGASSIVVDGVTYRTKSLLLEVIDEASSSGGMGGASQRQQGSGVQGDTERSSQGQVAKDDILLRAVVSDTSVFKGESLRVTFKLYLRVDVVGYDGVKFPSFNGFWSQELTANNNRRTRETYNGKVYETMVAREFLLYPQQAGTLTIDPAEITAIAQVMVQSRRNADPFFGSGHDVVEISRKVQSQYVSINVKPLPSGAPASFSGAVGSFTLDATLPPNHLGANSAATYTVRIAGRGNLNFVQAPKLTLPASFEQYNVKTTESINPSSEGISGYRQFEYPFIARAEGNYEVAPVEFCFFEPARMQYVVLRSKALTLEITPDASGGGDAPVVQGRSMAKEEVKLLGQDIRFIKLGGAQLRSERVPFLFSGMYWLLLAAIVVAFGGAYIALRRKIRESQNLVLVRGKRASKVAVQRFRIAKRSMEEQNRHAFYEEMLRALWGYMSDRFNIPVANLTKENVREELNKRGTSAEEQQRFTAIITQCDEAQYSPAASAQMNEVYTEGVDLISRIEGAIKR